MKTIDIEWLKKIKNAVAKQERVTATYRPDSRCNKEVLINRYFKFLQNKSFKLYVKGVIHYGMFVKSIYANDDCFEYNGYGVSFHLGWGDNEYDVTFLNEKCKNIKLLLHWNDVIDIQYEEIENKKFFDVLELFTL